MKNKLIQLLKDFEDESIQERFRGEGHVPYEEYADNILDLFEEQNLAEIAKADTFYRSDWINLVENSIQDEIS